MASRRSRATIAKSNIEEDNNYKIITLDKQDNFPPLASLSVSTISTEIYTNILFTHKKLYELFIIPIDGSVSYNVKKKTGEVNKKTVSAPKGKIWNVQYGPNQKGLILPSKKKANFRNQLEFYISMGHLYNVNVMMFNTNFKLTGTKSPEDTREAVFIIWRDYLSKMGGGYTLRPEFVSDKEYSFIFDITMKNHRSSFDFAVDQRKLNTLMNSEKYSSSVYISQIVNSSVNMKFTSLRPDGFLFPTISFSKTNSSDFKISHSDKNIYENKKKKKKDAEPPATTIIVFSSGKFIVSGRFTDRMENVYNFFIREFLSHKKDIEFNEVVPKESFF